MSYNKNEIEFCIYCGCEEFKQIVIDRIEHTECEIEFVCENCRNPVNLWSYGYFENDITPEYLKQKKIRERISKLKNIMK